MVVIYFYAFFLKTPKLIVKAGKEELEEGEERNSTGRTTASDVFGAKKGT